MAKTRATPRAPEKKRAKKPRRTRTRPAGARAARTAGEKRSPDEDELAPEAPRGADERGLEYLGSRARSVPLKPATVRAKMEGLWGRADLRKGQEGEVAHDEGTGLIGLYMRHADAVLGFGSFRALLLAWWPDRIEDAYERIRIARYCTRAQARAGISKCIRGIRLMAALELPEFGALLADDPPLELELRDGTRTTFAAATVEQLEEALSVLGAPPKPVDETAGEVLQRMRLRIRGLIEKEPAYEALRPTASLEDGEIAVRVRPRGRKQFALAARFYAALARMR